LVAYIVPQAEQGLTVGELRDFASGKLPHYMIPSAYVMLETLPLTPNGKVNRRALPAPEQAGLPSQIPFVAPRTPTEARLAEIWQQVLGRESIGIYDNFFELGGHSLLATRVMSRVREAFHVETPLRALFETPSVAGLAEAVNKSQGEQVSSGGQIVRSDGQADVDGALARLDELADEELDLLLSKMLLD
jgi:acyl carrier protein